MFHDTNSRSKRVFALLLEELKLKKEVFEQSFVNGKALVEFPLLDTHLVHWVHVF